MDDNIFKKIEKHIGSALTDEERKDIADAFNNNPNKIFLGDASTDSQKVQSTLNEKLSINKNIVTDSHVFECIHMGVSSNGKLGCIDKKFDNLQACFNFFSSMRKLYPDETFCFQSITNSNKDIFHYSTKDGVTTATDAVKPFISDYYTDSTPAAITPKEFSQVDSATGTSLSGGIYLGDDFDSIQPEFEDNHSATPKMFDDDFKLRLKCLTANQLASIGVVQLVEGKADEIVCPFCGNGTGSSRTGLKPIDSADFTKFHCFKCGANFDNLDLFAMHFGLDIQKDFREILSRANDLSQGISVAEPLPITTKQEKYSDDDKKNLRRFILDAAKNIEFMPVEDRRGLSLDTLRHFYCGYVPLWRHPKVPNAPETPRLIIPNSDWTYNAILPKRLRDKVPEKYWKMNVGTKHIFNFDAVTPNRIIAVVEGEIDAMSIAQATGGVIAIATCGTHKDATKHAMKLIAKLNDKFADVDKLSFSFLILFDNDDTGKEGAKTFTQTLIQNGYPATYDFLSNAEHKVDANDILVNEGDAALKAIIENIIADAQEKLSKAREDIAASNSENVDDSADNVNDELARLKALPPSKERDAQLIAAINDKLYLTPQRKRAHMKWIADSLQENVDLIFSYDPVIDGLMAYDEFYRQYTFLKPVFWREGDCTGEQWKDSDDKELRRYLRKTYQNFKGAELIDDNLTHYSGINSFHPVKQYLESLQWDGIPRAETYFSKFLNIDDTEYSREITRKWLLGAISRIYHEGCDFQFALVLHGKQGIGKGYCLRMLGQKWHIVLTDSLDDSHALDAIERGWIVEIEEWAAGRKTEVNAQKSFLSANADTRRRAWGRRAATFKRHCVFAISVNDEHFLRDLTGNRRFKILESHSAQNEIVEGLTEEYVDQVWAEVFQMYQTLFKNGFNDQLLRLSREVDLQADEIAEKHLQDDGLQGEIAAFLDKPILPDFIWVFLTKEERRKFFADGRIAIEKEDITTRIRTQLKRLSTRESFLGKFNSYYEQNIDNDNGAILSEIIRSNSGIVVEIKTYFYGTVVRESTCAAEIFSECFGNDKRKSPNRINEILSTLKDWKRVSKHIKNFAGVYGDQRNIYFRYAFLEKMY